MNNDFTKNNKQIINNLNIESNQDFGLNQEAMKTLVETNAGGLITKNLVAMGEQMLIDNSKRKK